jgi:hypothetical protein
MPGRADELRALANKHRRFTQESSGRAFSFDLSLEIMCRLLIHKFGDDIEKMMADLPEM